MLEFDLAKQPYRVLVDPLCVTVAREGVRRTRHSSTLQQVCLIELVTESRHLVADPDRDVLDQIRDAQAAWMAQQIAEGETDRLG